MWVEFVVASRPCSEKFFSGYSGFPLASKTNISKFQFDPEAEGHRFLSPRLLGVTLVKQSWFIYFIYLFCFAYDWLWKAYIVWLREGKQVVFQIACTSLAAQYPSKTLRLFILTFTWFLEFPKHKEVLAFVFTHLSFNGSQSSRKYHKNVDFDTELHRVLKPVSPTYVNPLIMWYDPTFTFVNEGASNFWVCGWNPKVWPFKWKLLSSTFLWCCLLCCTSMF